MLYVPRYFPNKLEYKVLGCISVHYQSRMASNGIAIQYSVFSNCSSTVTVSPSGPRKLFKGVTTDMSGVIDRFPLLLPVRNPVAGYGASTVTRTPDRGHVAEVKNQRIGVAGSQSGFPKKPFSPLMSTCAVSSKHNDAEHRPHVVWIID